MAELEDLLKKLETAKKPDRMIDAEIAAHVDGWKCKMIGGREAWRKSANSRYDFSLLPLEYTASADVALALVERRLPGWSWRIEGGGSEPFLAILTRSAILHSHSHKSLPSLTLLGALMRALITQEPAKMQA